LREREVISGALSTSEQRELLRLIAKVQQAAIQASTTPSGNPGLKPSHARPVAKRRLT
jgi:hypothetical protein